MLFYSVTHTKKKLLLMESEKPPCELCDGKCMIKDRLGKTQRWLCQACRKGLKRGLTCYGCLEKGAKKNLKECPRCQDHYHKDCYGKDPNCPKCTEKTKRYECKALEPLKCTYCRCYLVNPSPCLKCLRHFHHDHSDYTEKSKGKPGTCLSQHNCPFSDEILTEEEESSRKSILDACFHKRMVFQNSTFYIDPFLADFFVGIAQSDATLIKQYQQKLQQWNRCKYPLKLTFDKVSKGYCVFGTKEFQKNDIICEYGGEVGLWGDLTTRGDSDCILSIQYDPLFPSLDLVTAPGRFGDIGRFFNYGKKKKANLNIVTIYLPDTKNLRSSSSNGDKKYCPLKSLLIAKKIIPITEELIWDYNSYLNKYEINGFV